MTRDRSFHDYVVYDLLGDISGIASRAMFGGWAIYKNGIVFGLILSGELYFKVDDSNRREFEQMESSHPFVYAKKAGKPITMSYWLVSGEILEDRERLYRLIEKSVSISRRKKV